MITIHDATKEFTGRKVEVFGQLDLDSSYTTGGYDVLDALTAEGMHEVEGMEVGFDGTRWYRFDAANNKLLAYTATATQVGNGTNLSTVVNLVFRAWGT